MKLTCLIHLLSSCSCAIWMILSALLLLTVAWRLRLSEVKSQVPAIFLHVLFLFPMASKAKCCLSQLATRIEN